MKIKQRLKKINTGTLRVHFFRMRMDLSVIQFIIVMYIAYKNGMGWEWALLIPPYILYKIHDIKTYMTQEVDYNFRKSKMTMQMYNWVKELHERDVQRKQDNS